MLICIVEWVESSPTWLKDREICCLSKGIRISIPRDQVRYLQGAVVDFLDTVYETGFVVRNPNA